MKKIVAGKPQILSEEGIGRQAFVAGSLVSVRHSHHCHDRNQDLVVVVVVVVVVSCNPSPGT